MINTLSQFFLEFAAAVYHLFLDMAPYLILGMTLTGILSVMLKKEFVSRQIGGNSLLAVIKASLFGVPLPLCSCGVLPTALFMQDAGASKPALQSFLISTPQTGADSIAATYGMLGPVLAVFRMITAFLLGIIGGVVSMLHALYSRHSRRNQGKKKNSSPAAADSEKSSNERYAGLLYDVYGDGDAAADSTVKQQTELCSCGCSCEGGEDENPETGREMGRIQLFKQKLKAGFSYGYIEFIDDIGGQFVVGLIIAGVLTSLIPADFFRNTPFSSGLPGMIAMVLFGIPLYMCSTSSIPIAAALLAKGISPGAVYVFLVAGPATNAATIAILSKRLGRQQMAIYLGTLVLGSIIFGYLLDWMMQIVSLEGFNPEKMILIGTENSGSAWISITTAILLFGFLLRSAFMKTKKRMHT